MKGGIRKAMVKEDVLRLLLVDDHAVVRKGLGLLLGMDERFKVVAEVERGDEACAAFEKHDPDVVLMDVRMPGKDGVEALAEIRENFPEARVLMLTSYDLDEDVFRALDAGASGYVLKTVGTRSCSRRSSACMAVAVIFRGIWRRGWRPGTRGRSFPRGSWRRWSLWRRG